jgi:hypothetical protein
MASTDEELNQLEKDIRQLKIEFEMYFGGGRPRPPADTMWRIEQMIKRYSERGANMNFAQRFRFNNLSQSYAKCQEVFRKRMKQKEEGFVQRHYGAAAKAIEAERARNRPPETPAAAASGGSPAARPRGGEYAVGFSDPEREGDKVKELYAALVEAKQQAGEKTDQLTMENFQEFVRLKTQQLKQQKGSAQVEYSVSIENGQVKLKARVKN